MKMGRNKGEELMNSTADIRRFSLPHGISLRPLVLRWASAICIALALWQPQAALGGDVKDVVANLYGGDGITLPAGFHSGHFNADST